MATSTRVRALTFAILAVLLANAYVLRGPSADVITSDGALSRYRALGHAVSGPPLPSPGVYLYDTTGFESVDRMSIRREYPAVSARIVSFDLGCAWVERVMIFKQHVESYDVCTDGTDAKDTAFAMRHTYFRVDVSTSVTCERGSTRIGRGMSVGETRTYECKGDGDDAAKVTVVHEGDGTATVEGEELPCRRVVVTTALSGAYSGVSRRALCTDERTGLVLTEERTADLSLRAKFLGTLRYTERATFRLRSLVPRVE